MDLSVKDVVAAQDALDRQVADRDRLLRLQPLVDLAKQYLEEHKQAEQERATWEKYLAEVKAETLKLRVQVAEEDKARVEAMKKAMALAEAERDKQLREHQAALADLQDRAAAAKGELNLLKNQGAVERHKLNEEINLLYVKRDAAQVALDEIKNKLKGL